MAFWSDLTTGKDNTTHDPVRAAIVAVALIYVLLMIWGMVMQTVAFFMGRDFELMHTFEAYGILTVSFGTYLMQGGGSLYFKQSTEPTPPGTLPPPPGGSTVIGIGNTIGPVEKKTEDAPHDPS